MGRRPPHLVIVGGSIQMELGGSIFTSIVTWFYLRIDSFANSHIHYTYVDLYNKFINNVNDYQLYVV